MTSLQCGRSAQTAQPCHVFSSHAGGRHARRESMLCGHGRIWGQSSFMISCSPPPSDPHTTPLPTCPPTRMRDGVASYLWAMPRGLLLCLCRLQAPWRCAAASLALGGVGVQGGAHTTNTRSQVRACQGHASRNTAPISALPFPFRQPASIPQNER